MIKTNKNSKIAENKVILYRRILTLLFTILIVSGVYSQEILTATDYFNQLANTYAEIEDYQADVTITRSGVVMSGVLFHKYPAKLRINFSNPEEQIIAFDGKRLVIYIPKYRVTMAQNVNPRDQVTTGASIASKEGLALLKRNYTVAYLESPNPVPLDREIPRSEMVIKLKLVWRSTEEGFRQIDISVGANGYIRRVVGITPENDQIQFDFVNISINQNIPDIRFEYTLPPAANVFENFLFDPGN